MADPFAFQDPYQEKRKPKGTFLSVLDYIDNLAQIPKDVLHGNLEGAGRQLVDAVSGPIRAIIPGDQSDLTLSRPEDFISSADLVGIDQKEHPILAGAANFVGDTLLNPLTYVPGGVIAKGLGAAGKLAAEGVAKLPGGIKALEGAETVGRGVRRAFGAQRLKPETQQLLQTARAAGSNEAKAGMDATKTALSGLNDNELNMVGDVLDNFKWQDGKLVGKLGEDGSDIATLVGAHPEITPELAPKITQAAEQLAEIGRSQKMRPGIFSPGDQANLSDRYLMRQYGGVKQDAETGADLALGRAAATKERTLPAQEDVAGFLNDPLNANVSYERNALKRAASRAEQQGSLSRKAEIGKQIFGPEYAAADKGMSDQVVNNIEAMAKDSPEDAQVLMDAFKGIPGRSAPMEALATMNRFFKPVAVYGAFIPKMGAVVRNKLSGIWQAASNPESRAVVGGQARRTASDLAGAIDDGISKTFGFKRLTGSELTQSLDQVDAAFANSGGSAERAIASLPPEIGDAVKHGVLDAFVSSEGLLKQMAATGWKKQFTNIMNWPAHIFQGVESRMRMGMYLDLTKSGKTAEDAAKIVKDSLYDYAVSSKENRAIRDVIPFFQYQAKAIPQQAKLLGEKPFVATGLAAALGNTGNDPIYPYMEGKLNIPLGQDEQGNNQYASGFGLPFESLNMIPDVTGGVRDFGRSVERDIVGSSSPLLKTAYGVVAGKDPFFDSSFGSYDKLPVIGHAGDVGRAYNELATTGITQPLDSPLQQVGKLLDDRRSIGVRALDTLTGANVVNVDPSLALRQKLENELAQRPDIAQHRTYYDKTNNPDAQKLIKAYHEAQKKAREKRKNAKG